MVLEIPHGINRTLKDKVLGRKTKIVEMKHESSDELSHKRVVYRRPLTGKKEKDKLKDKVSAFIVKPYETVVLLQLGKLIGVLSEGVYEIEDDFQYTGTEIIWIDQTEFRTRWGTNDIYLKDNIKVGAHGFLLLKVKNARNFVLNAVSNKKVVEKDAIDNFIFGIVNQTFKDILGDFEIEKVIRSRDKIKQKVEAKLYDLLNHWGLELVTLEVEGFKLPEEFEELGALTMEGKLDSHRTAQEIETMKNQIEKLKLKKQVEAEKQELDEVKKIYERKDSVLDAKTTLEQSKYLSEAEKIKGSADSEVLERKKRAEVAGDVAKMQTEGEKEVKVAEIKAESERKKQEEKEDKERQLRTRIKELEDKLDQMDSMLAEGKLDKEIYKIRVNRIEKKLKSLENQSGNL